MFHTNIEQKMIVDARELVFLRKNGPSNLAAMVSENTGINRSSVNNELSRIKNDYNETVITEARRLVKAFKGVEFNPVVEA